MSILLSASQMREIETREIDSGQVSGLTLMERAGAGVVEAILSQWPDLSQGSPHAVVLCGPGNNGGDGFVVARLLYQRGWTVAVSLLGDPGKLPPDARENYDRWLLLGPCTPLDDRSLGTVLNPPDLVVDALFGTGLVRPVDGPAAYLIGNLDLLRADADIRCVSVDIPSGLCADSGRVLGCAPQVDLTVSFHRAKPGHFLSDGARHCGCLTVADIGLPDEDGLTDGDKVRLIGPPPAAALAKTSSGQKYTHGHALVLSGGEGRTGAARLAARASLRIGAGLVTLGVPPTARAEVASHVTSIMQVDVADAAALAEILWDTRLNAICLGPGLGLGAREGELVRTALSLRRPAVLDADALSLFQQDPSELFDLLHDKCILTPHGGEFARLFPDLSEKLTVQPERGPAFSRVDAVRAAARRAGCTILLKGPDTVIAGPERHCSVHSAQYERAVPWLATAGAGDVLAGLSTGLMARGLSPQEAAETAVWLHAESALYFGPGLIAEDLPEMLPSVLRRLMPGDLVNPE